MGPLGGQVRGPKDKAIRSQTHLVPGRFAWQGPAGPAVQSGNLPGRFRVLRPAGSFGAQLSSQRGHAWAWPVSGPSVTNLLGHGRRIRAIWSQFQAEKKKNVSVLGFAIVQKGQSRTTQKCAENNVETAQIDAHTAVSPWVSCLGWTRRSGQIFKVKFPWPLVPETVPFGAHVGHCVSLRGTLSNPATLHFPPRPSKPLAGHHGCASGLLPA